jgi:hypothetical protein
VREGQAFNVLEDFMPRKVSGLIAKTTVDVCDK